jgi:hypothetical protein
MNFQRTEIVPDEGPSSRFVAFLCPYWNYNAA